MRRFITITTTLALAITLLAVLFPILSEADPLVGKKCVRVTNRPLSDFLNAQGTLNDPPQFFPPVKDYVGWGDNPFTTFALVDYAGLANKYIKAQTGHSLGTKVSGIVIECEHADHTAQITVALFTTRALGFAQSDADLAPNYDFLNTPTIFGAKAQDVINGADAAVGPVILLTTFSISAPGAALPDFLNVLDLVNNPQYAPVTLNFTSTTFGRCSDGTKARLDVHQVAATDEQNALVFSKEKVEVVDTDGGHCGG